MAEAALLTPLTVRNFKPRRMRRRIRDLGARSLFLIISPQGHRSWMMRLRGPDGRTGKMILGSLDQSGRELDGAPVVGQPLSLAAARMLAATILRERALGRDPIAEHKSRKRRHRHDTAEQQGNSFAVAAKAYIAEYARQATRGWQETGRILGLSYRLGETEASLIDGGLAERWADRPVREIDRADVLSLVDECRRRNIPGLKVRLETISDSRARKMLAALSAMFGWLRQRGRVDTNPCEKIDTGTPGKRSRWLDSDELRWLWQACNGLGPHGSVVRLLILTGARLREVAGMRRSELSGDGTTWNLPAARTKNKRPHTVPLAPLARAVIESGAAPLDILFSTTGGRSPPEGWSHIKLRLDAAMLALARAERGPDASIPAWRLHDLRRTAVTGMAELGVAVDVIELVVNHAGGSRGGIAGVYNRSELIAERRAALERWAAHIERLVTGDTAGDRVVSLRG